MSKLTDKFLEVANQVLNEDLNSIVFTNEELVDAINENLEESERISKRTFQRWSNDEAQKNEQFVTLIKKARRIQKGNLLKELRDVPNNWQRFAWILERKFTEYNLKKVSEVNLKTEPITININLEKE